MPGRAVFRCDASAEIGTGHVVRCLALAQELRRREWTCTLVTKPETLSLVSTFLEPTIEAVELDVADDPGAVRSLAPDGCDLLVVDSYSLEASFERAMEGWAAQRLVIDDVPSRPHEAELLLDQTLGRQRKAYAHLVPDGTRTLTGPGFALLRPCFAAARPLAVGRRSGNEPIERVLVALGGAPSAELMGLVLAGVEDAQLEAELHLVPGATNPPELPAGRSVTVHRSVPDMPRLMTECDVAIGAGGTSSWERCCLGLPTLLIRVAANQDETVQALSAFGAGVDMGPSSDLTRHALAEALRALARAPEARASMARRAALVCDGLGVRRVVGFLAPRLARTGLPVTLRPVGAEDARLTFDWQQIPEMRRHTPNPMAPTWDEHSAWFERRLSDPTGGPFSIIEYADEPVGVLRLDSLGPAHRELPPEPSGGAAYVISILVAPSHHGKGIAAAALRAGRDLLPEAVLYAEVLPANTASHRLFQGAGYLSLRPGVYVSRPARETPSQPARRP